MAHIRHLPGQQIGKLSAICDRIVVAALFVRQERIRHFLPNVRIDVVLL